MVIAFTSVEKRLIEEVHKNDVLIIVGETGSGKTTRKQCLCECIQSNLKLILMLACLFVLFLS